MKFRTRFVTAFMTLVLAVSAGCVQGPIPDESTQLPGWYRTRFKEWGVEYNQHRDSNFRWRDGSRWRDGVSHESPTFPLDEGESIGTAMTCAQEEIVWVITFPWDSRFSPQQLKTITQADRERHWASNFLSLTRGMVEAMTGWMKNPFPSGARGNWFPHHKGMAEQDGGWPLRCRFIPCRRAGLVPGLVPYQTGLGRSDLAWD